MDKILLLLSLPGFGRRKVSQFIIDNRIFMDDDEYIDHFIRSTTGNPTSFYWDKVKRLQDNCQLLGIEIITTGRFPILDAPLVLFLKGDKSLLDKQQLLAVVGTRKPTMRGLNLGKELIEFAINKKWITVSGLAKGCDTMCHKESIRAGGRTIAVLPSGYNKNISPWLLESGLIISEYPPLEPIKKYRCIERNRIITGLSKGLYVVESNKGGGSEHSINFAYNAGLPIAYSIGFKGIELYDAEKIIGMNQFDQYLQNCIK